MRVRWNPIGEKPRVHGSLGRPPFDARKKALEKIEQFQQTINDLEKNVERSIQALRESKEKLKEEEHKRKLSQEGLRPLNAVTDKKIESKYDLAELFRPPRMTEMPEKFGLKGGWSVADQIEDPITKRPYYLRNRTDQTDARSMSRRHHHV